MASDSHVTSFRYVGQLAVTSSLYFVFSSLVSDISVSVSCASDQSKPHNKAGSAKYSYSK